MITDPTKVEEGVIEALYKNYVKSRVIKSIKGRSNDELHTLPHPPVNLENGKHTSIKILTETLPNFQNLVFEIFDPNTRECYNMEIPIQDYNCNDSINSLCAHKHMMEDLEKDDVEKIV